MFNFLIHVGRAEPAYATRFAAILLRTMLMYVSSDRFSRDNTVDDVSFFKVNLKNIFMHNVNFKIELINLYFIMVYFRRHGYFLNGS